MRHVSEYLHPLWLRFSRDTIHKSSERCEHCHRPSRGLRVHHLTYHPGVAKWEYHPWEVIVLCRPCHENIHSLDAEWGLYKKPVSNGGGGHGHRSHGHQRGKEMRQLQLHFRNEAPQVKDQTDPERK